MEIPHIQHLDRDVIVVVQRQSSSEIPPVPFSDRIVNVFVALQWQVPVHAETTEVCDLAEINGLITEMISPG